VTHLRKLMLEELQRRHYSEATTQRYIRFIERFAQHFHRSPDRLGPQHIREYQAQLFTVHKPLPSAFTLNLTAELDSLRTRMNSPPPKSAHIHPTSRRARWE
jgi:integrase/recombinase XerD